MHYYFEEKPFFSQFTENQLPGFGPPFILCQKPLDLLPLRYLF